MGGTHGAFEGDAGALATAGRAAPRRGRRVQLKGGALWMGRRRLSAARLAPFRGPPASSGGRIAAHHSAYACAPQQTLYGRAQGRSGQAETVQSVVRGATLLHRLAV